MSQITTGKNLRSHPWLFATIGILVLLAVAIYFFDWNMLRGFIAHRVTAQTGRPFAINGDLHVHLSANPRISAEQIVMGNADWNRDENMLEIERLDMSLNLWSLLRRPIIFHEISLSRPRVMLEKNRDGEANWDFANNSNNSSTPSPTIESLTITDGKLQFRDPTTKSDLTLDVSSDPATANTEQQLLSIAGHGRFKALQADIQGRVGSLLGLRNSAQPYPLNIRAKMGATSAYAEGSIIDPLHLKAEDVNFRLEGSDLSQLFTIVSVPLPPTPAYKLSGHLTHDRDVWTFKQFKGTVGNSDLSGDFSVDRGKSPQLITANLHSRLLDMQDLGGFVGGHRGNRPSPVPPAPDKILPREPFDLTKLKSANADVVFTGDRIATEKVPIVNMSTHLKLSDGLLKLDPLKFTAASGQVASQLVMDSRRTPFKTQADISVKSLRLEQLFPNLKISAANAGAIGGRAKLDMTGNAINEMLGSANGDAALIMDGGTVSELALRLSSLDLANSLGVLLTGDKQVPVNCMVSDWKAVNGDFQIQNFVLDTTKVNIQGTGHVDFKDESLDLKLASKGKGFSLASLRGPINVGGTLKNPAIRPGFNQAITRGALATALGIATGGLGAFIPLLQFGSGEDSNCSALIQEAQGTVAKKPRDTSAAATP